MNLRRRTVLAGLIAAATLPGRAARAQNDGFFVLRARPNGFEGTIPGPLLRLRRGEELKVRLVNETQAPAAIHWHGVRVPNAMDGSALAQKAVPPGGRFDYRFTPPDAGTFWYRASPLSGPSRSLFGPLIVGETPPIQADDETSLAFSNTGDTFRVNGAASLDIAAWPNHRVRLRLINAGDRFVTLRIDDHPMHVIAIDGQPAEPFLSRNSQITLSPGNRADVLVDCVMKASTIAPIVLRNGDADTPIARLVYGNGVVPPGATMPPGYAGQAVKPLPPNPLPERMDFRNALRVELALDKTAAEIPAQPLFSARRGRTVQLALKNTSGAPGVVHIHGHSVRLLDALDDGWKPFWLDTILCAPQQTTRVAFVADNPGKWLLDARPVGADRSQFAWFEVT
jgi:FtsP/CotA-like multicopper oxidase with cupredoxin domain